MAMHVVNGALLQCSFGAAPSSLVVLPINKMQSSHQFAANIMDHVPMVNIQPFGMCSCPANPAVASATTAAAGVLTPMPCIPATTAPWAPGSPTVMLANQPVLNNTSTLLCTYGGVIAVNMPGQTTEIVP
jgi:hypothetical protein